MRVTKVCAKAQIAGSRELKVSGFHVHSRQICLKEEFDYSRGFLYNQWTRREKIVYLIM